MSELQRAWRRWERAKRSYRRAWKRGIGTEIAQAQYGLNSATVQYVIQQSKQEADGGRSVRV